MTDETQQISNPIKLSPHKRHGEVVATLKEYLENPANFIESGPVNMHDLSLATGIGYHVCSTNVQMMVLRRADPKAVPAMTLATKVKFWHRGNSIWCWTAPA